jgi:hypothetical protein
MVLPNASRFAGTAGLGTKLRRRRLACRIFKCAAEVTQKPTSRMFGVESPRSGLSGPAPHGPRDRRSLPLPAASFRPRLKFALGESGTLPTRTTYNGRHGRLSRECFSPPSCLRTPPTSNASSPRRCSGPGRVTLRVWTRTNRLSICAVRR